MATLSSHLLNSVNGTHASGVKVIINQINSSGEKKYFLKQNQMRVEEFQKTLNFLMMIVHVIMK